MIVWNTQQILHEFGGVVDLHAKLKAAGHDVTLRTVRGWGERNAVPGKWLAVLLDLRGENPCGWLMDDENLPNELEDIF